MNRRPAQTLLLALTLLALPLLAGCAEEDPETAILPTADASLPIPNEAVHLHLTDQTGGLTPPPAGPFRVLAVNEATAERADHPLGDIDHWPHDAAIELPAGNWTLTVYLDRAADGDHDPCPFPPEPAHTENADHYDNLVGTARLTARSAPIPIAIDRRLCGPGDPRTGIAGTLIRPADPALDDTPIFALITPLDDAVRVASQGMEAVPQPRPLRVPLAPTGAPIGETPFSLGELIPGRYRIDIFADHDADHHPTPCAAGPDGPSPGGGDRYLTTIEEIEITAGTHTPLPTPVELRPAPCPAALTGITGRITLAPELAEARPDFDPLLGELRLQLTPADGGPAVLSAPIGGAGISATNDPRPFVTSGLPPGDWRIDLYLDRDFDGRFTPCNDLLAGFDAVHTALGDVAIHADELTDLGDIELIAHCDGPPTGLSGRIEVDIEEGPARSARPVRLALMPLDEGERRALPLFDAHDTLDGTPGHFSRRVPPGRYRARIYVDTDRDGELRRCDTDPFGDRAASEPFDIEITPDTITRLEAPIPVRTLGCPLPAVTLAPRIALDALAADGPLPAAIELHLAETGGWTATYTLPLAPDVAPLLAIDLAPLAPGRYRLTAYVDGDADGELDPCDATPPDPYQTRIEFTLDANNPTADPLLRPEPCAP